MFPIVLVIINDVVPILSRIVPERSYSRWLTRYLKIFFSLSLSSISLSTGNAPSCREICQKRKSFKMTVLQHELQYLVISFQQASVTSIELSKREKLTKHAFSSLKSGEFFFLGTTDYIRAQKLWSSSVPEDKGNSHAPFGISLLSSVSLPCGRISLYSSNFYTRR